MAVRIAIFALTAAAHLAAQQTSGAADFFEKKVRPLLSSKCGGCHNARQKAAGLDFTTSTGLAAGNANGHLAARLIAVTSYDDKVKMPPTGKLPSSELADLKYWADSGAPLPQYRPAIVAQASAGPNPGKRNHWSFLPVRKQQPPAVRNQSWVSSPVDAFIAAKLEAQSLPLPGPADKLTLLRRAKLDLHGLAPTEEEIQEFVDDDRPDAYARLIDRLLASPRYGETWGRHWLDVARYAETSGVDDNVPYPEAWRYREYVIDAFNRDLPFDQFIREQVAGDLIPAPDGSEVNARGIVATGFLALGPKAVVEIDKTKTFYDAVDEQIDTTTKAFLGLTISCARCHDHKFDPVSTRDYYSLAAIFANTRSYENLVDRLSPPYLAPLVPRAAWEEYRKQEERIAGLRMLASAVLQTESWRHSMANVFPRMADYMVSATADRANPPRDLDPKLIAAWVKYLDPKSGFRPHLKEWHDATASNQRAIAEAYQAKFLEIAKRWQQVLDEWRTQTAEAVRDGRKLPKAPNVEYNDGKAAFSAPEDRLFVEVAIPARTLNDRSSVDGPFVLSDEQQEKLLRPESRAEVERLRKDADELAKAQPPVPPQANAVAEGPAHEQKILLRGNHQSFGEPVGRGVPEIIRAGYDNFPASGSGRGKLAEWLTDRRNPLTARVIANRIWQWHFGHGLVRTPNNFGVMGEMPTHPELLDYLASKFMDEGWSLKSMHRSLMLSSTYRASSAGSEQSWSLDPGNRLFSRFERRRLRVEEFRDVALQLAGELELKTGGIFDPVDAITPRARGPRNMAASPRSFDVSRRRSIYLNVNRTALPEPMVLNDFVDSTTSAGERPETITAPQALFLMNSPFVAARASAFARKLLADSSLSSQDRIRKAALSAWTREPSDSDLQRLTTYIENYPAGTENPAAAWESLCRYLLSSNRFHYVD